MTDCWTHVSTENPAISLNRSGGFSSVLFRYAAMGRKTRNRRQFNPLKRTEIDGGFGGSGDTAVKSQHKPEIQSDIQHGGNS